MIYQHPLAYLVGIEGIALLRGWAGDFDREYVEARLAEVRRLLADDALAGDGVLVARGTAADGYRQWSATYDAPRNTMFDHDEPTMYEILDALPAGVALDAACGTGRYAEHLVARGHRVTGVDGTPEMLARARIRVPEAEFLDGDLHRLPVPDGSVDLVVCGLALSHVPDLAPVLAEFARVLRTGGQLVVSDAHPDRILLGSVPRAPGPDNEPGLVATYRHQPGDMLRAALPLGFRVLRCEEPCVPVVGDPPPTPEHLDPGPWHAWPWSLLDLLPEAVRAQATVRGLPSTIVWQFQRA